MLEVFGDAAGDVAGRDRRVLDHHRAQAGAVDPRQGRDVARLHRGGARARRSVLRRRCRRGCRRCRRSSPRPRTSGRPFRSAAGPPPARRRTASTRGRRPCCGSALRPGCIRPWSGRSGASGAFPPALRGPGSTASRGSRRRGSACACRPGRRRGTCSSSCRRSRPGSRRSTRGSDRPRARSGFGRTASARCWGWGCSAQRGGALDVGERRRVQGRLHVRQRDAGADADRHAGDADREGAIRPAGQRPWRGGPGPRSGGGSRRWGSRRRRRRRGPPRPTAAPRSRRRRSAPASARGTRSRRCGRRSGPARARAGRPGPAFAWP